MFFVYILKSLKYPEKTYTGYTIDLAERLKIHNAGKTFHTAKYKPWTLFCFFAFSEKHLALKFEIYLKSHAGRAFIKKRFMPS